MSEPRSSTEPRYMGGQAVLEGVMMRGASTWAIAVRKPDGEISVDVREVAGWSDKYNDIPVVRGVMSLAESLGLGYRALTWSANQQIPEEDQISEKALGWAVLPVALVFSAVFIVIPAFAGHGFSHWFHGSFPIVEGVVRLVLFVTYLTAMGFLKDIRRVFQYHGAEHKAIAAYENDVELTPQSAQQFTTAHVRCGTNFLLTVMVLAVLVYSVIPRPNLWFVIGSRILLTPVIAGLAYEVIRYAAKNMQRRWVRVLVRPGLWLQRLTTREPDLDQLEVAIASLRAVFTADQTAEVDARVGRRSRPSRPLTSPLASPAQLLHSRRWEMRN